MSRAYRIMTEREAAAYIAQVKKADIAVHASPDADTLGCALALSSMMNGNGADARVVSSDEVPLYLRFLTDIGKTEVCAELREGACRISVDVASPGQLGKFEGAKDTFSLMLDHHMRGEMFADGTVEADAAACGEIVFRILKLLVSEFGWKMTKDAPSYIYAAISGDTGSFRFSNTTPTTHLIAAELHEMGADTVNLAHALHAVKTPGALSAEKLGLMNMQVFLGGRLRITSASYEELCAGGIDPADFSEADLMRSVLGALVGVSLKETEPGVWRASTRANVPVDCAAVCGIYGGGGHTAAAGCTLHAASRDEAVEMMRAPFCEAIERYERGNGC